MDTGATDHRLALVIEPDTTSRRSVRRMLGAIGLDVVQVPTGLVGLELIQRLPETFQLVLTELELPGIPGQVVMETLMLFRPELPVLCMAATVPARGRLPSCLEKPLDPEALRRQVHAALAGAWPRWEADGAGAEDDAVLRAQACYARGKSLVEAALELARGCRGG